MEKCNDVKISWNEIYTQLTRTEQGNIFISNIQGYAKFVWIQNIFILKLVKVVRDFEQEKNSHLSDRKLGMSCFLTAFEITK